MKTFIDTFVSKRSESKTKVKKETFKFILNSTFGKICESMHSRSCFGFKDRVIKVKISVARIMLYMQTMQPASRWIIIYFCTQPLLRYRELVIPISPFYVFLNKKPVTNTFTTTILSKFNIFLSTLRIRSFIS